MHGALKDQIISVMGVVITAIAYILCAIGIGAICRLMAKLFMIGWRVFS